MSTIYLSFNQSSSFSVLKKDVAGEIHFTLDILLSGSSICESENFWLSDEMMELMCKYVDKPEVFLNLIAYLISTESTDHFRESFDEFMDYARLYSVDSDFGRGTLFSYTDEVSNQVLDTLRDGEDSEFAMNSLGNL